MMGNGSGRRLPIRWRLTLWNVALLAVALLLFALAFYFGLRQLLYNALDASLDDQADIVQQALDDGTGRYLPLERVAIPANDDQFVRIYDARGSLIYDTSDPEDAFPIDTDDVSAGLRDDEQRRWYTADDGDRIRFLVEPIERDDTVVGVVEVGVETETEATLGYAKTLIAGAVPVILLFAVVSGAWLSGRALSPIDRITRTAAGIGERDLAQRIALPPSNDEVGRLAATFNAMLERIELAFGRQRRFTADAAHELRTPLALMQSQLELALAQERDPQADRVILETLAGDVNRLARLSAALLALARSDARGIEPVLEKVDLAVLLELVAEQYAPLADASHVDLVVDAQPVELAADQDLLIQVLVNLLDNALRHAPRNSRIVLGCRAQDGRDVVSFWVADAGPGIPASALPHLFERFYRVEADRDRQRGGIGLGLSICKMIVDAHGGTIDVASTVGTGTIVTVNVPRRLSG